MIKRFLPFVTLALFFNACTYHDPELNMKPPVYVEQLEAQHSSAKSTTGSLFGSGSNPLFSDNKAMSVNDIVTVIISESTNQSSKASKSTNRGSNANLGAGLFAGGLEKFNKHTDIGFKASSSNDFNGGGSQARSENFKTTISARIIKVLENGNYFIEGRKQILLNGEKQIIQISGVIRPYDITGQNTIESKYIADAKILYSTQGEIDKATRKPWGTKALEAIWPF